MKKNSNINLESFLKQTIDKFEDSIIKRKNEDQTLGIIYTPQNIANSIVKDTLLMYFYDILKFNGLEDTKFLNGKSNTSLRALSKPFRDKLIKSLKTVKVLDPACGSGRFLIAACEFLYDLYIRLNLVDNHEEIKKSIIQNNIFGIDIVESASKITKIKLLRWLIATNGKLKSLSIDSTKYNLNDIEKLIQFFNLKFNILTLDYLFDFNLKNFEVIVGNPPYIENKKIINNDYKKRLKSNYESAYRLYDLSILFIEKSIEILSQNGYLSFLATNKFLSAEYGLKIRNILLERVKLKQITNVSSLPIFHKTSVYPIILTLKKEIAEDLHKIKIKNVNNTKEVVESKRNNFILINQNALSSLPGKVIPLSEKISLVNKFYNKYQQFSEVFKDLEIIYRPFGFINWVNNFDNVSKVKKTDNDLLLIGTGNVAQYHVKFKKPIKIAKKNLSVSYFNYKSEFSNIFQKLKGEKLIYREVAKKLTCVYDPGIFVNITGLYFILIPSLSTEDLFALVAILNSKLINDIFTTLFGTLHMSGGYMRYNAIFIKRLPMINHFNSSLSRIGMILQFLYQLKYELSINKNLLSKKIIKNEKIERFTTYFETLSNDLVYQLFFPKKSDSFINKIMESDDLVPLIQIKYFNLDYLLPKYSAYTLDELQQILNKISKFYLEFRSSLNHN